MKSIALFYGNCQAGAFRWALPSYSAFAERFEPKSIRNFRHPTEPTQDLSDEEAARCRLIFEQISPQHPMPEAIREKLPSSAVIVRFPPLDLNLLWPLHGNDPRNVSEPALPFGRFPYGDRVVVALLRQGLSGEALWVAYQHESVVKMPNLDRLWQMEDKRLAKRDEFADVKFYPIIQETLAERPIFASLGHPMAWLMRYAWNLMIGEAQRRLGLTQLTLEPPERVLQHWDPLGLPEVPVHPAVARHLDLKWWTPDHMYRDSAGMQTWEQYMRRYIDWR